MKKESEFQKEVIDDIKRRLPGAIVMKTDPSYIQGFPDLLILFNDKWATLEVKKDISAAKQPNQSYYVQLLNSMSFSKFIFPQNRKEILDEMERSFRP